nr:MAG TPA: Protein of unknown function (DUF938) [Caudoviricetes sp.]
MRIDNHPLNTRRGVVVDLDCGVGRLAQTALTRNAQRLRRCFNIRRFIQPRKQRHHVPTHRLQVSIVLCAESYIVHNNGIKHRAFSSVQFEFSFLFNSRQLHDCVYLICNRLFSFACLPAVCLGAHRNRRLCATILARNLRYRQSANLKIRPRHCPLLCRQTRHYCPRDLTSASSLSLIFSNCARISARSASIRIRKSCNASRRACCSARIASLRACCSAAICTSCRALVLSISAKYKKPLTSMPTTTNTLPMLMRQSNSARFGLSDSAVITQTPQLANVFLQSQLALNQIAVSIIG